MALRRAIPITGKIRKVRHRFGPRKTAKLARLRDREASLVTLCTESPKQLAKIRLQIARLEGAER